MILVDVVPSSRYSIKSIIFERLRSFLRQKERATWNETKRKNFRNNIQHPFKYFTDPPPPPLPPRSPTIHIYYFLSLFFFFFPLSLFSSCDYPHSLLAFIRSRAQVSPPYPPLRSFRRYERCQILSIYCVANIGPTSFSRTCKSVFLFCKLGDGATLPLNPFLRTSPLVSPFYLFRFSSLFPPPPSSSPRSPTRSLARISRRYPAHSISVCIIQDIYTGTVRDGLTGAPPEVRQTSPEWPWIVATSMDTPSTDSQCLFRTVATPRLHKAFTTFLTFGEPGREIIIVTSPNSQAIYIYIYLHTMARAETFQSNRFSSVSICRIR